MPTSRAASSPGYDFIIDPAVANDGNGRDSDRDRPGRLGHERRERERLLRGLRHERQLVARHPCRRARSAPSRTTASASPGSTRSRRSSRCGCSASAAATRATSPTRSAGRPGSRSPACRPTRRRTGSSTSASAAAAPATRPPERDQRGRRRRHGCRGRRRQQQRERRELRPGQLRQRDHGRGHGPHRQAGVLLELRHLGRDRGAGRRRAARQDDPLDAQRGHDRARAPTRTRTTRARAWRRRTSSASSR